jgi:cytosine/adenosine deaminase-related metal-dependent hydrolase
MKARDAGLRENARFLDAAAHDPLLRGAVGAHASFTLSDGSLARLGELAAAYTSGVHIHLAEDRADVRDARRRGRGGIVARLERFGLLNPKSILAHAVHSTGPELRRAQRSGAWLVHNPRSNMNNAVGAAPLHHFGNRAALGTDGFPADMFEESKIGFVRNREERTSAPFSFFPGLMAGGHRLVGEYFGRRFGALAPGSAADLILLDYAPPTPFNAATLHAHLLFGMHARMVTDVMVEGRWIMRGRRLTRVDEAAVMAAASKAAARLWKKASLL